jgi:hypothetical protein
MGSVNTNGYIYIWIIIEKKEDIILKVKYCFGEFFPYELYSSNVK